jgi:hypothetical protein
MGTLAVKEEQGMQPPFGTGREASTHHLVLDRNRTTIRDGQRELRLEDLHVGDKVSVKFEDRDGQRMVRSITVDKSATPSG